MGKEKGRGERAPAKDAARLKRFIAVAAGAFHTILLKQDGSAMVIGSRGLSLPPPGKYIDVAANGEHSLFLRSDGEVIATGIPGEFSECCSIPVLPSGTAYTSISTGGHHSILLRSDGEVVAFGHDGDGRCNISSGREYVASSAGLRHSLLFQSDGHVAAFGCNRLPPGRSKAGPCDVPLLPAGLSYSKELKELPERRRPSTYREVNEMYGDVFEPWLHTTTKRVREVLGDVQKGSPYCIMMLSHAANLYQHLHGTCADVQ